MLKMAVYREKTDNLHNTQYVLTANNLIYLSIHLSIHVLSIQLSIFPTNTMYQSRSQGPNISLVNQSIPHILLNPKVRHTFRHIPLLVPILRRLNPVHINTRHFFRVIL